LLDLVRIVAVALVVTRHVSTTVSPPQGLSGVFGLPGFYYVSIGGVGVTIFLVLSGLCLQLRYEDRTSSYGPFLVSRCIRIYPIYYMAVLTSIPMYYYKNGGLPLFDLWDYICTATGLYAFAGRWGGPLVATSWFVGVIVSMYLLFPILTRKMRTYPHVTIAVLFMIGMLSRFIVGRYGILPNEPLRWFPLCNVFEFGLGMYLATVVSRGFWKRLNGFARFDSLASFIGRLSFPLFLVHFPLLVVLTKLLDTGMEDIWAILAYLIVSLSTSTLLLSIDNRLSKWLKNGGRGARRAPARA
jgi:peptidoglycan/LPS O-acetylase OafA/YrhL